MAKPRSLLFIHRSIGAQLLADPGSDPRGGGLRRALVERGFVVRDAGSDTPLGVHTGLFDWLPKFRDHMADILGSGTDVVLFKSCFPNNFFDGAGLPPGDARGPALTEANARAALLALLPLFAAQPRTLFVHLTTPPLSPVPWPESGLKALAKGLLGRENNADKLQRMAEHARRFREWSGSAHGLLADAPKNFAVFDYAAVLSRGTPFLQYATGARGEDSHPSSAGQQLATAALVPFLEQALTRLDVDLA